MEIKKDYISEDYISFELAKLLKEKGFDYETVMVYDNHGEFGYQSSVCVDINRIPYFNAPTVQTVVKWLDMKGYCIAIYPYDTVQTENGKIVRFVTSVCKITDESDEWNWSDECHVNISRKDALEDAIKVCLNDMPNIS